MVALKTATNRNGVSISPYNRASHSDNEGDERCRAQPVRARLHAAPRRRHRAARCKTSMLIDLFVSPGYATMGCHWVDDWNLPVAAETTVGGCTDLRHQRQLAVHHGHQPRRRHVRRCPSAITCQPGQSCCVSTLRHGQRLRCAVKTDGTVWCAGENITGIGRPELAARRVAAPVRCCPRASASGAARCRHGPRRTPAPAQGRHGMVLGRQTAAVRLATAGQRILWAIAGSLDRLPCSSPAQPLTDVEQLCARRSPRAARVGRTGRCGAGALTMRRRRSCRDSLAASLPSAKGSTNTAYARQMVSFRAGATTIVGSSASGLRRGRRATTRCCRPVRELGSTTSASGSDGYACSRRRQRERVVLGGQHVRSARRWTAPRIGAAPVTALGTTSLGGIRKYVTFARGDVTDSCRVGAEQ